MVIRNFTFIILAPLFVIACAQGNCRSQGNSGKGTPQTGASVSSIEQRIRVFKYDGSLQCGLGKAIPLDEMAKELKGITIHSKNTLPDGLMHISQCGTPTGKANVYEIDRKDLSIAQKAGFKEWLWE